MTDRYNYLGYILVCDEIDHGLRLFYFVQRGWRQLYLSYGKIKGFDQHIRGLFVDENSLSTNKSNERLAQLLDHRFSRRL